MHPVLFRIPAFHFGTHFFRGFDVYTYGVVLSIAFAFSLLMVVQRAKRAGVSADLISDLCILLLIAGVVGSRLLFVIESWGDYKDHFLSIFNLREGGLSISGGLIFGFLAGAWFVRRHRRNFWKTADILAPSIALGMGLGRIGCFFNGCCVGTPSNLPWAVVFPANPAYFGPRHPTQIYEMIPDLLIAFFLLRGFKEARPGTSFLWCAALVSTARFFVEFLRADAIPFGFLSLVQWICLVIIAASAYFLVRPTRRNSFVTA